MNAAAGRALAGTTILQLVPALREEPTGHAALDIVRMLVEADARAMVAGCSGPLVDELRACGGEWLPLPVDRFNPLRIHSNARKIANLVSSERIDIVHAHCAAAAWAGTSAKGQLPVFVVTSFPITYRATIA